MPHRPYPNSMTALVEVSIGTGFNLSFVWLLSEMLNHGFRSPSSSCARLHFGHEQQNTSRIMEQTPASMRTQDSRSLFLIVLVMVSRLVGRSGCLHSNRLEVDRRMTSVSVAGTNRPLLGPNGWASMVLDIGISGTRANTMKSAVQHDFLARLKDCQEIAERTIACRLEKPPQFTFTPGQFIEITLLNPPESDVEGNSRAFSIASSPEEEFLLVATRVRDSAFKRVLSHASSGTQVQIGGPFGDLRLHNNSSRAAVILCGGIGITPFRSILLNAAHDKLPHRIFLFYSNRRPEDAPFLDELQSLENDNPNFKLIVCMTEMEKSSQSWAGERGWITSQRLARHLSGILAAVDYVTGPPAFVKGMRTVLMEAEVDDDDIRIEEFGGY